MPSVQSTVLFTATLLGSLLQHAAAAPEAAGLVKRADLPQCIATCMRNSGCFDSACICKKAADGILSDIAICMNQWCPADVTVTDLINPLKGECDLPKSSVQDAEKKGGVAVDDGDDTSDDDDGKDGDNKGNNGDKPTSKGGQDEITQTFDVGAPVTAPAPASTTLSPPTSGTLTVSAGDAATTGLLIDGGEPTTSPTASPTLPSPTNPSSAAQPTETDDPNNNGAGVTGQASIFAVVAAMAVALVMGL
jgi:hypothetical protein